MLSTSLLWSGGRQPKIIVDRWRGGEEGGGGGAPMRNQLITSLHVYGVHAWCSRAPHGVVVIYFITGNNFADYGALYFNNC